MTIKQRCVCFLITIAISPCFSACADKQANIQLNHIGYLPTAQKIALVTETKAAEFSLHEVKTQRELFTGELSKARRWPFSETQVKMADFSEFTQTGIFELHVNGLASPALLTIGDHVYADALFQASKSYYYNRAGVALTREYAGDYARPLSHPDNEVLIHASAASKNRPEGYLISSPKGWFDAGDFNKYIVNSNISVYTLFAAWEDYNQGLVGLNLQIPESSNALPDYLDEILWNVDWMLSMQDPNDGGVYHKLTTKKFTPTGHMPHTMTQARYLVAKSSAASLGFAAVMAQASRLLAPFEAQLPGYSNKLLLAAKQAWQWSLEHPDVKYVQASDIFTGEYAQKERSLDDEWLWAAAELFVTSNDKQYLSQIKLPEITTAPSWSDVGTLGLLSLAKYPHVPQSIKQDALSLLQATAREWIRLQQSSAYHVAINSDDFVWGSNGAILNKAFTLLRLDTFSPNPAFVNSANHLLDYVLGRNPLNMTFVTGLGKNSPQNIHHRVSMADEQEKPIPGLLAGGPHSGQQDRSDCEIEGADYSSKTPALSYLDHSCSFASNEIAINWNAPLVYVLAAFQ